jgi:hypothetical protein
MPTTNPNDVKNFVSDLYQNGLTNNEKLQGLLWQIKMVSELSNEELGIKSDGDWRSFFIKFMTDLANNYRPSNQSEVPQKLLKLYETTLSNKNFIYQAGEDLLRDLYLAKMEKNPEKNEELIRSFIFSVAGSNENNAFKIRQAVDELLAEINY